MRAVFIAFLLILNASSYAVAETTNKQAESFVTSLFQDFQDIYDPAKSDTEQALLAYYQQNFDHQLIARFVLGGYGRRASSEQKARFADLLPRFILAQISPQIGPYFAEDKAENIIKVLSTTPLRKGHVMVKTLYQGRQDVEMNVRLRPVDNVLRIVDVQVAGISMLMAQRDLIASMIKQKDGDMNAFLEQLAQRVENI